MEIIGTIKQGETKMKQNKFITVLRKNLSYLVVALCILAVGLAVVFVMLSQNQTTNIDISSEKSQETVPIITEPEVNVESTIEPTSNIPEPTPQKSISFTVGPSTGRFIKTLLLDNQITNCFGVFWISKSKGVNFHTF